MTDAFLKQGELRQIESLPDLADFGSLELDISETCERLFASHDIGLFKLENGIAVVRHDDLKELAAHPFSGNTPAKELLNWTVDVSEGDSASEDGGLGSSLAQVMSNHIFTNNPPIHGPLRRMFIQQVGPKTVGLIRNKLQEIANQLAAENTNKGTIDFSSEIASAMTARVAGLIFGVNKEEQRILTNGYGAMADFFRLDSDRNQLIAADKGADRVAKVWKNVSKRYLESDGPNPFKALEEALSRIEFDIEDPVAGRPPEGSAALLAANMLDLVHTGSVLAPCVLYHLLLKPDMLSKVQEDPNLVTNAVSEVARLSAPVRQVPRYALEDFSYKGVAIPKGTTMYMYWEVGNRDPKVFENPHQFRLDRPANSGVTFGGGAHVCPGRHIGIATTEAIIRAVVKRPNELKLEDTNDLWDNMAMSRMVPKLPIQIIRKL
jgi:cytochrome P450